MLNDARKMKDELTAHRRQLHEDAETGFDLEHTQKYVMEQLIQMGYKPQRCGKAGIIADLVGGDGPAVLLRADMDALPISEESGLPYACQTGNMHACGHDLHAAMLLGAAKLLKSIKIPGTIRFLFQAAEELLEGAQDAIDNGALEGMDAAMMIHVTVGTPLPVGFAIISSPGISAPAADYFTITVKGKSCHGSAPQDGIDPLPAAAQILLALQNIQTRELGLNDRAVLTIGSIHGGTAANVIADTVQMRGSLRTADEAVREKLHHRMEEMIPALAAVYRAEGSVRFDSGCPCLVNDAGMSNIAARSLKDLLGEDMAKTTRELDPRGGPTAGGSEDFAYISHRIPSVMVALSAGNSSYPLHHPRVVFDEGTLPVGAAVYAQTALDFLKDWRK